MDVSRLPMGVVGLPHLCFHGTLRRRLRRLLLLGKDQNVRSVSDVFFLRAHSALVSGARARLRDYGLPWRSGVCFPNLQGSQRRLGGA